MKKIMRFIIYIFGLFIITIGINLSITSHLGISPVSSFTLPLSQSIRMSLGTVTTGVYIIFVIIQFILLQKNFKKKHILQIPFSILFGYFLDVTGRCLSTIQLHTDISQFIVLVLSIFICAIGATMYIAMDIVPNAPEGLQLSICERFHLPFSKVKMVSDCVFVIIGLCISFMFLNGVTAIREGTILSALLTGKLIGLFSKRMNPVLQKIAFDNANQGKIIE